MTCLVALSRVVSWCCLALLAVGCASYGPIENLPKQASSSEPSYSLRSPRNLAGSGEQHVMLAFSGGGTRAAALSYGVLKALRDTRIDTDSGKISLLDEVRGISSVSGGSFTSAYYGLYGEEIFENFESDFLRRNIQGTLLHRLLNPFRWFTIGNRTEWAIDYYEKNIFKGATYADLMAADGPLIVINASDLTAGVGFWFTQEYFDLLCSDISSFPISRAVAASSAVPGLFAPVVLANYDRCSPQDAAVLESFRAEAAQHEKRELRLHGLTSYADKERKPYLHLVDGGITDNLGLRGIYDTAQYTGGLGNYYKRLGRTPPRRIAVVVVNAATETTYEMSRSNRIASVGQVVSAMSELQLNHYSADTLALLQAELPKAAADLSAPGQQVDSYFIEVSLDQVADPVQREFLNSIPTSFSLTDEQVDALIEIGGDLLRANPAFQKLVTDANSTP